MPARTLAFFWGATIAAVCFLGAAWAAWEARADGPSALAVFALASIGLVASGFVAGRIMLVIGRLQRHARDRRDWR